MALYLPPLHINTVFNAADYNFQNGYLSYGYAESRYIRKIGSDTVGADILFTKSLSVSGTLNITGAVLGLTKNMVGLGNCDNTSDLNKPISTATQSALTGLTTRTTTLEGITTNQSFNSGTSTTTFTNVVVFSGTVSGISKTMVGLGSVDNTSDASKPISTLTQGALDLKAPLANPVFTGTVSGITKGMVGLGSVDNTSDASKPISTAVQTALTPLQTATTNQSFGSNTTSFTGEVQTNDVAITRNLACNNAGVSGVVSCNTVLVQNNITCSSLSAFSIQYDFKPVGFLTNVDVYGSIPLCKTIQNTSIFCGGSLDLNAVFVLGGSIKLFLFPNYKVVFYDRSEKIQFTADNTAGSDMGYFQVPSYTDIKKIIIYNNNVAIL